MTTQLNIGPDESTEPSHWQSSHVLNLRNIDHAKQSEAHRNVSVDLKEEIKSKKYVPGRICILAELPDHKRGLSRVPMLATALLIILMLNLGQLVFLGKKEGGESLALAGEAFLSLEGASQAVFSGEEGSDLLLFGDAEKLFAEAKAKGAFLLQSESPWLTAPEDVQSLQNLLDAGTLITEVGQHLATARTTLSTLPLTGSLTQYLRAISESNIEPAAAKIDQINTLLSTVDLSKTTYTKNFQEFQSKLSSLSNLFDLWIRAKEPLLTALGDRYPQHYLVLLQNNDEMRLGGGFIGSLVLLEINDGRLTNLEFHDVYDFDGSYFTHQDVPVHELRSLTNEWRLRDSNISADFSTSAEKAMWFLEEEGGPGVDGVIAVNLSAAQAFLEDTGPLTLPSLNEQITAETFPAVISTLVEAKVNKESPKAILGELLSAFMEKLGEHSAKPSLQAKLAMTALDEGHKKQILLFHKNPSVEALISSIGMSGELPRLSEMKNDFFMPLFTNQGGNKTDRYIKTALRHDTQIAEDGSMVSSVSVARTHTFSDSALSWLKTTLASYGFTAWNPDLEKVLGKDTNHTGIRLYVPEEARILETEGILRDEIQFYYDPLEDVSYYFVDQILEPGQSESFTIHFALPWNFRGDFEEYKFDLFKQPGLKSVTFEKTVNAPGDTLLSGYPLATGTAIGTDYVLSGPFHEDTHITLLYH